MYFCHVLVYTMCSFNTKLCTNYCFLLHKYKIAVTAHVRGPTMQEGICLELHITSYYVFSLLLFFVSNFYMKLRLSWQPFSQTIFVSIAVTKVFGREFQLAQ